MSYTPNGSISSSTGVMYSRYIKDDLAIRGNVRLGYQNDKIDDETPYGVTNDIRLEGGIQKNLVSYKKLTGYAGADAFIGGLSEKEVNGDTSFKKSTFEFGIKPFMGVDCWFVDNFFIGVEWGYDIIFNTEKGKMKSNSDSVSEKLSANTILGVADLSSVKVKFRFAF